MKSTGTFITGLIEEMGPYHITVHTPAVWRSGVRIEYL